MNDLNWMNIDLPSLQSFENERGGSFVFPRSILLEGIEFDRYKWTNMI